jgi:hypothetical protein
MPRAMDDQGTSKARRGVLTGLLGIECAVLVILTIEVVRGHLLASGDASRLGVTSVGPTLPALLVIPGLLTAALGLTLWRCGGSRHLGKWLWLASPPNG